MSNQKSRQVTVIAIVAVSLAGVGWWLITTLDILSNVAYSQYQLGDKSSLKAVDKSQSSNLLNMDIKNGSTLAQQGDFLHALKYYNRALTLQPNNTNVLINAGNALSRTANYTNAIKYYDKALSTGITNKDIYTDVLINKGNDFFKLKDYKDAISSYDKALQTQPTNTIASEEKNLAIKMIGSSTK